MKYLAQITAKGWAEGDLKQNISQAITTKNLHHVFEATSDEEAHNLLAAFLHDQEAKITYCFYHVKNFILSRLITDLQIETKIVADAIDMPMKSTRGLKCVIDKKGIAEYEREISYTDGTEVLVQTFGKWAAHINKSSTSPSDGWTELPVNALKFEEQESVIYLDYAKKTARV